MSNLKPSLSLRRQVDVIEFNLRAKEKIFGDRCRTYLARARQRAKRKFQRRAVRRGLSGHNTVVRGPGTRTALS